MSRAVVALGANLGDRAAALQVALDALARFSKVLAVSAIFETDPVGGPEQPDYYNAVVVVETELSPSALLDLAHDIEAGARRERLVRWGPRTLDVDIVAFDDIIDDDPRLTLPHPRAHERAFVLLPWADADSNAALPGYGPVSALVQTVDASGVRRLAEPALKVPGAN